MSTNPQVLTTDDMFGPSDWPTVLLRPRLTSAGPSESLTESIVLSGQPCRPPRVRITASAPHPPYLPKYRLMALGFVLSRELTPVPQPPMRFLFIGSELCLQLPSDPTSRWTPLLSASSFRHQDLQGTLTPKPLPCRAHVMLPRGKPRGILSAALSQAAQALALIPCVMQCTFQSHLESFGPQLSVQNIHPPTSPLSIISSSVRETHETIFLHYCFLLSSPLPQ